MISDKVIYHNYRLTKKVDRYDDRVAIDVNKITKKTAIQMTEQPFSAKNACR